MADNVAITAGTGTTIAADDISGVLVQRVKTTWGPDGTMNDTDVASGKPLPVQLRTSTGTATPLPALGTAGTASSDVITVQGVASMTKLLVTPDLPSGASTAAKQPALGTAGSSSTDVLSVQGIASGTALPASQSGTWTVQPGNTANTTAWKVDGSAVTQPVSGTVTANAGTGTLATSIADGSSSTLGAKADAKSSATDTTSISAMSVLKQISASVQAPPSQAVTNAGTFAAQITAASGALASGSVASGAVASGAFASGALASGSVASGAIASGAIAAGAIAAGATSIADNEDVASADGDRGVKVLVTRKATPANTSGTDGDYEFLQESGGYLWVHDNKGLSNLAFSAAFTTLTRPANTTAYAAADSISDNATAGSVTALSATLSDTNDDPIFISEILVSSTDTGLNGKKVRAYLFNSDPTASTGVGGGDNAAYSQKKAGYIGSFMGWMETGFSDGSVGRLVPTFNETNFSSAGGYIVTKPTSGAKTLYIQYQAVEAFTPSANSTTIIGTARGWQGRAV